MTSFTASRTAHAEVRAPREDIWAILVDPSTLAPLVPFVRSITALEGGTHWHWQLSGLSVAGLDVAPAFTERMTFTEPERIEFRHDPPAGTTERAGVVGWYDLQELRPGVTALATSLEITLDLPLPGLARPAVTRTMSGVVAQMGDRFAAQLLRQLGVAG
ncbi:hypothetical protein GCM10022215_31320 [Nocardioides fonticola]|uniref:SRPBCC family protein n=1 Tax=Nocardioides fonticola TaxID=450363 RepID=A0ABP7XRG1_9ACTN